jgi:hypothetical protein
MKKLSEFVLGRLMAGALVVAPTYLAVLRWLEGSSSGSALEVSRGISIDMLVAVRLL